MNRQSNKTSNVTYKWLLDELAVAYLSVTIIEAPGFSVNESVDMIFLKIETKLYLTIMIDVHNGILRKQF
jgi:hypothetical protein